MNLFDLPTELIDLIFEYIPSEYEKLSKVCNLFAYIISMKPITLTKILERLMHIQKCIIKPNQSNMISWKIPKCMYYEKYDFPTGIKIQPSIDVGCRIKYEQLESIHNDDVLKLSFQINGKEFESIFDIMAHLGWNKCIKYLIDTLPFNKVKLCETLIIYDNISCLKYVLQINKNNNKLDICDIIHLCNFALNRDKWKCFLLCINYYKLLKVT